MKLLVLTAPSGAGKTTLARRLLASEPGLRFSVSATTRPPRAHERDGVDYHFLTPQAFRDGIEAGDFVEFEEVYPGRFYGTPHAELAPVPGVRALVLDLDVKGALNVRQQYGTEACAVFIRPPDIGTLEARLRARGTETEGGLATRLARAELEMSYADAFDHVVVNDDLDRATDELGEIVRLFLANSHQETPPDL